MFCWSSGEHERQRGGRPQADPRVGLYLPTYLPYLLYLTLPTLPYLTYSTNLPTLPTYLSVYLFVGAVESMSASTGAAHKLIHGSDSTYLPTYLPTYLTLPYLLYLPTLPTCLSVGAVESTSASMGAAHKLIYGSDSTYLPTSPQWGTAD